MGKAVQEQISITDYLVPLVFQATNIPDATGNANTIEPTTTEYVMPFAGCVVGISASGNALLSTGTLTFNPSVNGVANTGLGVTLTNAVQRASATKLADAINFSAGQRLGVPWTKTGTISPTTTDANIVLWVLVEGVKL